LSAFDALPRQTTPTKTFFCLAVLNRSTQGPYGGIVEASCNTQSAPGQLAGTLSRKDHRMQAEPTLRIDIVSDIV
jgi:hypothetical protein